MLARRLPLILLLATACTAKQEPPKQEPPKQEPPKQEQPKQEAPELPPHPTSGPSYALIAREAIGPIRMGMSKADIEALGILTVHPKFSAMTIPITVYYDDADQAKTLEISLAHTDKDVTIGEVTIPRGADLEQIRKLLGDCQEPEVNTGAAMHPCRGGAVVIAIGSGSPDEIWLRTDKQ